MKWVEVSITTSHEATEAITNIFHDLGAGGVVIEDEELLNRYKVSGLWDYYDIPASENPEIVTIKAYLLADNLLNGKLKTFKEAVEKLEVHNLDTGEGKIDCKEIYESDWSAAWKEYFHTFKVGERVVIKPSWEEYIPLENDIVIDIDPSVAFGTGTHASTKMCLELLEEVMKPGYTVFDIGTGSGILSIASAKLGAEKIIAVDNDKVAVKTAFNNVIENEVGNIVTVKHGDLLKGIDEKADIIVANIIADVIISILPDVKEKLSPDGSFIASGIILERLTDVINAIEDTGLYIDKVVEEDCWAGLLISHNDE